MGDRIKKHLRLWLLHASYSAQISFSSKSGVILFIIAKVLRFSFFFIFLFFLQSKTGTLAGYTLWQSALFFLTFVFIDNIAQLLFREIYRFRQHIVSGYFDYILLKPYSPLARSLLGGTDLADVPLTLICFIFLLFAVSKIEVSSTLSLFAFIALICNGLVIALALHIMLLAVGVLVTALDNTLFFYRDLTQMGRLPIDIYQEPIRGILTFIIPVGIMMTFPAKALFGLLDPGLILLSFGIGLLLLYGSYLFWQYSLRYYSSASS